MNGAGGLGQPTGVERVTTHLDMGPSALTTSDNFTSANFNTLVHEWSSNPSLFGSYAEALITHEDLSKFLQQLGTHINFNSNEPLSTQIPRVLQTLATSEGFQVVHTHEDIQEPGHGAATDGILQEGTVLGVDINAHNLNICQALKYYEKSSNPFHKPIYLLFQAIALFYMGSRTGFTDEQIAKIRTAQVAKTVKNMGEIKKLLDRRPIHDYIGLTADIGKLTGGLVISVTHPVGRALKQLKDMVSLYDRCLERAGAADATPEQKASVLEMALKEELKKGRELSEGQGFPALSWGLQRIALAGYEAQHPVKQVTRTGENGLEVPVWVPTTNDGPDDDELVKRMVVACYKNGIRSANAIEAYFEGFPPHFRDRLKPVLHQVVVEEHIIDPYEPTYNSSMGAKKIMEEELRVCKLNMPAADRNSTSKIMDYLEDYRGISRDIEAKKEDGKVEKITEKEFHDFVRGAIVSGELNQFKPATDIKMSPRKRLEEEFRASQLNMSEQDRNSPSKFMSYLEKKRDIYNVQVTREEAVSKITEQDVYSFIEKAIAQERLGPYEPIYDSTMSPEAILKEELRAAWFNMPEDDRYSSNAVINYLKEKRKILEVKATRVGEEGTVVTEITEQEIDDFIHKAIARGRLSPYKPTYDNKMSPEGILEKEFTNALQYMEDKRYALEFFSYLQRFRDLSDVKATRPNEVVERNITEREIYAFINKLIVDGKLDQLPSYNEQTDISVIFNEELLKYWLDTPENAGDDYNTAEAFKEHLAGRNILNIKCVKVEDGESEKISQAEVDAFLGELIRYNVMPAGRAPAGGNATPQPGASPVPGGAAVPDVVPQADIVPAAVGMPGAVPVAGAGVPRQAVVRPEVLVELQQDWIDTGQGNYSKQKEDTFRIMTDVDATDEEFDVFFAELKRLGNLGAS